jgi:hypothetical protein
MTKVLTWVILIAVVCYLLDINLSALIAGVLHGAQQMHAQQSGKG